MASWPMEAQTSVAITSACSHAAAGSVQISTPPPVGPAIRVAAAITAAAGPRVSGAAMRTRIPAVAAAE